MDKQGVEQMTPKIIKDFPGKTVAQYLKATGSLPDEHILQVPSELLLLFSDPLMGPSIKKFTSDVQRELAAAEKELVRLRKDPDDTVSDHPGCVFCMEAGTPVGDGEVCPKCGDRLPTRRLRRTEAELAAANAECQRALVREEQAKKELRQREERKAVSGRARNLSAQIVWDDLRRQLAAALKAKEELERRERVVSAIIANNKDVATLIGERIGDDAYIDGLVEAKEEAEQDARRYRWLRSAGWFDDAIMESEHMNELFPETIDAAIDVALLGDKP
jgi:ribosomal protein L18